MGEIKGRDEREQLLSAWLRITSNISQLQRFDDLRYNEAVICNLLMKNKMENPGTMLTATDLCRESHIMKSQMNRTLQAMEEKGIVRRHRSTEDRRRVFMELREDSDLYDKQHARVLRTVDALADRLEGLDLTQVVAVLDAVSEAAEGLVAEDRLEKARATA